MAVPTPFKSILAIKLRELGDIALWTSALDGLREAFPTSRMDVLIPQNAVPLLEMDPRIHTIHAVAQSRGALFFKLLNLRKFHYDLALAFHATTSLKRFLWLLGAKQTAIHHHSLRATPAQSILNVPNAGALENAVLRDWRNLQAVGIESKPSAPRLYVSEEKRNWAVRKLTELGYSWTLPILVLLPGARVQSRRYPKENWLVVLETVLAKKTCFPVVLVDKNLSGAWGMKEICGRRKVPLFDDLNLSEVIAILSQGHVAVGNDSGLIHICAALGLRTLTLFGPGCLGDWHPYDSRRNLAMQAEVDCRLNGPRDQKVFQYCTQHDCADLKCLKGIEPAQVTRTLASLLQVEFEAK
ncbi:MAG: glycosyltransferase family 9 protein [Deltaproteobacteria bacterium]|nr:glycosyltransferase family 9 protein [Deltaproteobacteria bacterium]